MAGGRRLTPQPGAMSPMTELVDPNLAAPMSHGNPVGSPAMGHAPMAYAQQHMHNQQMAASMVDQQDRAGQELPVPGQARGGAAAVGADQFPGAPAGGGRRPPEQFTPNEPFASFHPPEGEPQDLTPTEENVTELTAEERAHFAMLMHVGRLTKKIDVYTHPVVIESLTVGDDQRIGMYCKDFKGDRLSEQRSYHIAVCAAGIRAIDNQPLYQPISGEESAEEIFDKKIAKLQGFYAPVITEIYNAIRDLDLEFAELAEKLGKRKG